MATRAFMIGEAARCAGVSPDTIRHYERVGLLPRAPRTAGGYRCYSEAAVARVVFVRNAILFGFSIKELAGFLRARDDGRPPCRSVRDAGERLLREMDRQLSELTAARRSMAKTLKGWDAKLARTPDGSPAHLLADIPKMTRRTIRILNPSPPRRDLKLADAPHEFAAPAVAGGQGAVPKQAPLGADVTRDHHRCRRGHLRRRHR